MERFIYFGSTAAPDNSVPVKLLRMQNADGTILSIRLRHKALACHDSVCIDFCQSGGNGLLAVACAINSVLAEVRHDPTFSSDFSAIARAK
jgi:hypothetical protein